MKAGPAGIRRRSGAGNSSAAPRGALVRRGPVRPRLAAGQDLRVHPAGGHDHNPPSSSHLLRVDGVASSGTPPPGVITDSLHFFSDKGPQRRVRFRAGENRGERLERRPARDRDPRACYALLDEERVRWDAWSTTSKRGAQGPRNACLDPVCGERLKSAADPFPLSLDFRVSPL